MEKPQDNDTMLLKDGFNFTPIDEADGQRCRMRISGADLTNVLNRANRRPGFIFTVTDLDTNKRYRVQSRPCNLPRCYCDASIREL